LKTAALEKTVPMDAGLAALLLDWRGKCLNNQDSDCVFRIRRDGKQLLWPSSAMVKHTRPSWPGIVKDVRWHVFRHSLATLLKGNGEDVTTEQESLRQADPGVTLNTYTQWADASEARRTAEGYCDDWTHAISASA
jgi:integrase